MKMPIQAELVKRMQRVALGIEPADIILSGGNVLCVYTGEVLEDYCVLIVDDRIAYVGPNHDYCAGPQTIQINLKGQVVIPGLIDSHCHFDYWIEFDEYIKLFLPTGTTTIITETTALSLSFGIAGVKMFIQQLNNYPMRLFATASASALIATVQNDLLALSPTDMQEILVCPEVLGIGEIYWSRVVNGWDNDDLNQLTALARELDKTVEGHGAGARNSRLGAYISYGIDSCHESISTEDVCERLRQGLTTMIREGSTRKELETIIPTLSQMDIDLQRAVLVTDGLWPNEFFQRGHMDYVVNKAIELGLNPIKAIQMATLNAAKHFNIDHDLGGIATGKYADLVVIPDISKIDAQLVISKGKIVSRGGKMELELPKFHYPEEIQRINNYPIIQSDLFNIKASGPYCKVRAIEMVSDIVNREIVLDLPVINGLLQTDQDVLRAAVIEPNKVNGRKSFGFIKGYGLRQGAIASSMAFDDNNMIVIGANCEDMAMAINRLQELHGGMVYCCQGEVIAEIPLPIGGSISNLTGSEVANQINVFMEALKAAGCCSANPILTIMVLTFTAIPSIRLTINGYWLSKENQIVDMFV